MIEKVVEGRPFTGELAKIISEDKVFEEMLVYIYTNGVHTEEEE